MQVLTKRIEQGGAGIKFQFTPLAVDLKAHPGEDRRLRAWGLGGDRRCGRSGGGRGRQNASSRHFELVGG